MITEWRQMNVYQLTTNTNFISKLTPDQAKNPPTRTKRAVNRCCTVEICWCQLWNNHIVTSLLTLKHQEVPPAAASSYGTLSASSASTRQDWSGSRTRNGGWYSKAVKMLEPRFCFWYRNQIPAETPTTVITLRMTRMDSMGLGSEQNKQQRQGHKVTTLCARGRVLKFTYFASLSLPLKEIKVPQSDWRYNPNTVECN